MAMRGQKQLDFTILRRISCGGYIMDSARVRNIGRGAYRNAAASLR